MQIGEFAERAGVSARALRHYEQRGLLTPQRSSGGYRQYTGDDLADVARIRVMIEAGLSTEAVGRYVECIRTGADRTEIEPCPALERELNDVERRLSAGMERLTRTREALHALTRAVVPEVSD